MQKLAACCSLIVNLVAAVPTIAGIAGSTADGTWDCRDIDGVPIGTVVVSDTSYAYFGVDGKVGPYGKLHRIGLAEYDLPHFVVMGGYLKDELKASGLAMTGPRESNHDLSGELFLVVIITETDNPYCRKRVSPAD